MGPVPYLTADRITKSYGEVVALAEVSLTLPSGECLALVGESGSGKSTLLRTFNRLVLPDSGRVRVEGVDLREVDEVALRRRIGYVPQDGGLLPHWKVLRNVALVPWLLGAADADARAEAALQLVGLAPARFAARWPSELSGGQRQRVALARALAGRPGLVLLDEPFGALDAITRAELQETFNKLRRDARLTAVLVTHDIAEALHLADQIAVLRDGRLEQVAPPTALLVEPATPYVRRLIERAGVRP